MKVTIDIEASDIVTKFLMEDWYINYNQVQSLSARTDLKEYERQDLADSKETLAGIEAVLRYYMYIGDYEEFISKARSGYVELEE